MAKKAAQGQRVTLKTLKRVPKGKTALRSRAKALKAGQDAVLSVLEGYDVYSGEAIEGLTLGALSTCVGLVAVHGEAADDSEAYQKWMLDTAGKLYEVLAKEVAKRAKGLV